ncbi:hypothetical protein CPLU01_13445 [Colletotrichum plurivorum]|uniref:Uncharacterized protein n=1 Tax=Colletotrichum plurivorum TaxID=2175906 RepID=A0A8H6JRB3_9PEZI|nr:hypothetical protein CPLU01_13445 [Colletotrichum plurivorum]
MSASLAPECNEVKDGTVRVSEPVCAVTDEKKGAERPNVAAEYLRGVGTDNNECADLFKNYQKCLTGALKERGIDKLLDEAREDSKENDATHLGRKCESLRPSRLRCSTLGGSAVLI